MTGIHSAVNINHAQVIHCRRKARSASTYWLSTNFYSLETAYNHCVRYITVMAAKKWHFVVYWGIGHSLGARDSCCGSSMLVCDDLHSVNSTQHAEVLFPYVVNINSAFHLTSYPLAISDYMGPVCGLLYGLCVGMTNYHTRLHQAKSDQSELET